jgi:transposase
LKREEFSYFEIRDYLSRFEYEEEIKDDIRIQTIKEKAVSDTVQIHPPWWSKSKENEKIFKSNDEDEDNIKISGVHNRIPRGVAKKFSQNINSVLSNYHNGNIVDFTFPFRFKSKKKSDSEFVLFEDSSFPAFLKNKNLKSQYWYTDKDGRKKRASLSDIINSPSNEGKGRGVEIIYDKRTDKFLFNYPVDYDYFPDDDRRRKDTLNENQGQCSDFRDKKESERKIIVIDPGIRKFGVGYDPNGKIIYFGDRAKNRLVEIMKIRDEEEDKVKKKLYTKKMNDMTDELHWKIIRYIMKNYNDVMIPDFKISGMVKGKKILKETKRLLYCFRFHAFMTKLKYKCKIEKKRLYIVNEAYTSKTCTNCGILQDVGGKEIYKCKECKMEVDRDVNGSRNILIKNIRLR